MAGPINTFFGITMKVHSIFYFIFGILFLIAGAALLVWEITNSTNEDASYIFFIIGIVLIGYGLLSNYYSKNYLKR